MNPQKKEEEKSSAPHSPLRGGLIGNANVHLFIYFRPHRADVNKMQQGGDGRISASR